MATTHYLFSDNALKENTTQEVNVVFKGEKYEGFLLAVDKTVKCYINSCPHTGATLNWNPNQFLTVNQEFIQCSVHGALFEKDSGLCIAGPCVGTELRTLAMELIDDHWYLVDEAVTSVAIQTGYSDNPVGT